MDKVMRDAKTEPITIKVGKLVGTGIKLKVTDRNGEEVHSGIQLNNTTLEIEALSELKVEVVGYQVMYEALKAFDAYLSAGYPENMKLKIIAIGLMGKAIAQVEKEE